MKKYLLAFTLILVLSCSKTSSLTEQTQDTKFFRDEKDLFQQVQVILDSQAPGETLKSIQSVSYINSKDKAFAFVFYTSSKKSGNVVIRHDYLNGQQIMASSAKCNGESCDCKVGADIGKDGHVSLHCSCSSCMLMVSGLNTPLEHNDPDLVTDSSNIKKFADTLQ